MKKGTLLYSCLVTLAFIFSGIAGIQAQGTENSGIVLRVIVDGQASDYYSGYCGYGTANWGGSFTDAICKTPSWTYDITPDTLGCDSVPAGSLTGKAALVRRGVCGFSIKALNAQKAGADLILIANNNADLCAVQAMGATQPQAGLVTVPCLLICGNIAAQIDNALKANKPVQVCVVRPDAKIVSGFFPATSMQTPVSQITTDTFGFGADVANFTSTVRTNVVVKVELKEDGGQVLFTATETIPEIQPDGTDTVSINFGGQLFVPALPIGKYNIIYTTSADSVDATPVKDRAVDDFYITQNLFAKDDGAQIGFRPGTFNGDVWGVGNVYQMSAASLENYEFRTAEFAFTTNATDLPVADVETAFYMFKVNDDVIADGWASFDDSELLSPSFELLGIGSYEAPANVQGFQLQQVEVTKLDDPGISIPLEAGKTYVLASAYSGVSLNTFHAFNQNAIAPSISTMVFNTTWFTGGFTGNPNAVLRMYIDLVSKTDEKPLPETVMNIVPNPVRETLNLAISFDQPTDATITIADIDGRVITMEDRQGLTNEMLHYQLPQLASGTYLARIATKEGTKTKKFIVQK